MRSEMISAASAATFLISLSSALPSNLHARQSIDFDLVELTPDPTIKPDNTTNFNPAAAIASVIADVKEHPLSPVDKRALQARDIVVSTYPGYTANLAVGNAAINAPLDCNKKDTYMGVKLFTKTAFDTALCAAACTAQSQYNVAHPPADRPPQTCQFYNTYALYKNDVYEGQYCTLYNQTWDATYAVNDGQWRGNDHYTIRNSFIASNATNAGVCPQAVSASATVTDPKSSTETPLDLTKFGYSLHRSDFIKQSAETNLFSFTSTNADVEVYPIAGYNFPVVPNTIYELSFDLYQGVSSKNQDQYWFNFEDSVSNSLRYIWQQQIPSEIEIQGGGTVAACARSHAEPKTAPATGQWNTVKAVLMSKEDKARLIVYWKTTGSSSLKFRNVYVRAKPSNFCD